MISRTNNPLVSICLLSYNDAAYVAQALQDLLGQDYQNIELIISDDCSIDNSPTIIQAFVQQDTRIRFFQQTTRLGMQGNYNFVLSRAEGEYFMWASSDDRWESSYVSTLVSALDADSKITSAAIPFHFIDSQGSHVPIKAAGKFLKDYESKYSLIRLIKFSLYYYDDFFYGLHRRSGADLFRVPVWWGPNKDIAANNNYPVQAFLLARGRYHRVKCKPMFLKRIHEAGVIRHSRPMRDNRLHRYAVFHLRKVNVLYETVKAVYFGSRSIYLAFLVSPFFILRCLLDCFRITSVFIINRSRKWANAHIRL